MSDKKSVFMQIAKGVFFTYVLNIIFILIYSAVLTYTNVSETTIPTVIFVISLLGVFISSSITAIKIGGNGLKYGALIGFVYIVLLYFLGCTTSIGFSLTSYSLATIIFNIVIGMVGGIVGVNMIKS